MRGVAAMLALAGAFAALAAAIAAFGATTLTRERALVHARGNVLRSARDARSRRRAIR